jgi:hypothetical protein
MFSSYRFQGTVKSTYELLLVQSSGRAVDSIVMACTFYSNRSERYVPAQPGTEMKPHGSFSMQGRRANKAHEMHAWMYAESATAESTQTATFCCCLLSMLMLTQDPNLRA